MTVQKHTFHLLDPGFHNINTDQGTWQSLLNHPNRVDSPDQADWVFLNKHALGSSIQAAMDLPRRSPNRPYLMFYHTGVYDYETLARHRSDIFYLNYDLGDHDLHNNGNTLPGVTLPPPVFFTGDLLHPDGLPSDPLRVQAMRRNIWDINQRYFVSQQKRTRALLNSIACLLDRS